MFGCLVAGRLLQTNLRQIDETHAVFELPNASSINHNNTVPEGYGCTVHLHWPGKGFQLLGMLSNEKPSSIFRLRASFTSSTTTRAFDSSSDSMLSDDPGSNESDTTAVLGLSIEPLAQILPQLQSIPANSQPQSSVTVLAERIVKHLFNYISGFASSSNLGPDVAVPMGVLAKWYEMFLNKVKNGGTGFLEREMD
ncbi:hypothetical protein BDP27DRAFT_1333025 [Rhodocollybia butyracea]|uniref:Hikeshi-like domain-containing protein n=1 Tax=Rhodocollybia butyracea TaxID=206335 RepID=A0A9P5U3L6_9AGAR|nr:hypothetical protein BDP27DRAFT_1333025 [Rhodocollybia butyracea]